MSVEKKSGTYIKWLMYLVAVVLVNIAGLTLFFRIDLTRNGAYSLSEASRRVASTLEEPLTIKVFFTRNLPAPHNATERYLRDLLEEYAIHGKKRFNYTFYDVSPREGDVSEKERQNRDMATEYGIFPVQIQMVERDELKFQNAFMGMVLIHGDLIEKIPTITSTDGLEYRITSAVMKMNNKISALIGLKEKVKVSLFFSSSLKAVAPYLELPQLPDLPRQVYDIVVKLNPMHYGKLEFEHKDTSADPGLEAEATRHHLLNLQWPAVTEKNIPAGSGAIGLVLEHGAESLSIPILQVMKIPIIGTHYQLMEPAQMEEVIRSGVESLIRINDDLGILADHGSLAAQPASPMGQPPQSALGTLKALSGDRYNLREVKLKTDGIPEGIKALIIPRPTEPFDDWALFQIDQFLMRGNSLALFVDPFKEVMPGQEQMMFGGQGPVFVPLDTGLEKLLTHYGLTIEKALVMDEECYRQPVPQEMGGGERQIYFAPLIQSRHIADDLPFMKNIKGLVALKAAPVTVDTGRIEKMGIKAHRLISSSEKSWLMKDAINLNPMFITPPADGEKKSYPLAYLLEGPFTSYFEGKPIPTKTVEQPAEDKPAGDGDDLANARALEKDTEKDPVLSRIEGAQGFISKGKPGKIFILAASDMLTDSVLDEEGRSPNALFILNALDTLNDRDDIAVLRAKTQTFNPLHETTPGAKAAIKAFNIAGLPVLTVLFGLWVWWRRSIRKRKIQSMFEKKAKEAIA